MENAEKDAALHVADLMAAAARTAPKGSGKDKVITIILTGEDKDKLAEHMRAFAEEVNEEFIGRDSHNVDNICCFISKINFFSSSSSEIV